MRSGEQIHGNHANVVHLSPSGSEAAIIASTIPVADALSE
jgi:hypothetical protein